MRLYNRYLLFFLIDFDDEPDLEEPEEELVPDDLLVLEDDGLL